MQNLKYRRDYGDLLLALAEAVVKDKDLPHWMKQRLFKRARNLMRNTDAKS